MFKVKLMNKIAKVGTDVLSATRYEVGDKVENEDAILVRSAALHEMPFGENLKAIARCARYPVMVPKPGPISMTAVSLSSSAASKMVLTAPSSIKKFCP